MSGLIGTVSLLPLRDILDDRYKLQPGDIIVYVLYELLLSHSVQVVSFTNESIQELALSIEMNIITYLIILIERSSSIPNE